MKAIWMRVKDFFANLLVQVVSWGVRVLPVILAPPWRAWRWIKNWFGALEERRCEKCPCGWYEIGPEDCDEGCHVWTYRYGVRFCPYALLPRPAQHLAKKIAMWREGREIEKLLKEWEDEDDT